ncbi:hypothetical protein PVK06_045663 [Gossypium arboreum]|uniref:beta-carotene 3-hydroxylase n=1 Tax=Gossypium arboreum TaxID=29729 RepID=A0ABR0MUP3_GOSAR|nr:hypothetical protein PVK06_045663 [Gossypium arboreum]
MFLFLSSHKYPLALLLSFQTKKVFVFAATYFCYLKFELNKYYLLKYMATLRTSTSTVIYPFRRNTASTAIPNSTVVCVENGRKRNELNVCMVLQQRRKNLESEKEIMINNSDAIKSYEAFNHVSQIKLSKSEERLAKKKFERTTYLLAAILSSLGISSMAIMAVYCRFSWQMEGGEFQLLEMLAHLLSLLVLQWGWSIGQGGLIELYGMLHCGTCTRAREGAFELNDVFAVVNALPAIALLSYGFFNGGFVPGLCFGAGLGITVFGMAYMFVHDGLVHRRFPVGPIANVPYLRKVAAAHQIHHADKFDGVPYGLFLGPQELEEVGGLTELEKEIKRRRKLSQNSDIL